MLTEEVSCQKSNFEAALPYAVPREDFYHSQRGTTETPVSNPIQPEDSRGSAEQEVINGGTCLVAASRHT